MLRPQPPPHVNERVLPDVNYDGILVVSNVWEAGDLVDWWCNDVWWEAEIIEVLGSKTVEVFSFPPFILIPYLTTKEIGF